MTASSSIQVALPIVRGETYDYLCDAPVEIGMRVRVPFGSRRLVGVVTAIQTDTSPVSDKLRHVLEVLDDQPLVDQAWLDLAGFAARYYQAPLGMAIATALPKLLRKGKLASPLRQSAWQLTALGRQTEPSSLGKAPRQSVALAALQTADKPLPARQIGPQGSPAAALRALAGKGLIETVGSPVAGGTAAKPSTLTEAQARAVDAINRGSGFACHLLEGVTGSGKTEVYLSLARTLVTQGRQCLLLVPEIGLTPQMVQRVRERTGARVLVLHSGLADGERHNAWLAARDGQADIILGTRSAVFVPLARPGLIVVDEEHDSSYKQQDGMRYHARDLAVRRAQQHAIPIVLGSATPALESHYNALMGRYQRHSLNDRYGPSRHPRLSVIDLRGQYCDDGLSNALIAKTTQHLKAGNQVLLFINRRGYSPVLLCHDCGWMAQCERCDARLISHQRSRSLRCHHCGHQRAMPRTCPDCGSEELRHLGQGTERIDARAAELWPTVARLRLDRDVLNRKGELEQALEKIQTGAVQLLIGTQMLAKGHDFPNLSLVGIIDADQGLYGQDFRAAEHLAQLVIQVSGRAGRRDTPGEVLLQTHNPEHPLLGSLSPGNYPAVADALLTERQILAWPPFSRMALIRTESSTAQAALDELSALAEPLYALDELDVLGPVPAIMERRGGQYRHQLLLRSNNRPLLQAQLRELRKQLETRPSARKLRWSIDVDPQYLD